MITLRNITPLYPGDLPCVVCRHGEVISEVASFLEKLGLKGVSLATIRAYAYDLLCFYRFLSSAGLTNQDLKPEHGLKFLKTLRGVGAAPRTINRRIIVVRSFLNFCKAGLGDNLFTTERTQFYKGRRNKALMGPTRIKGSSPSCLKVKVPRRLRLPLGSATIQSFIGDLRSYRDKAITALMLYCGLRSLEVLKLQIYDIDIHTLQIRIWGKGDKERLLPITQRVRHILEQYLKYERPNVVHTTCFLVLKGRHRGRPMPYEALRKIFRHRRKGNKDLHPHRLRHTFCTNLIRQGVSLPVAQKLMGHADIESTMNYINLSLKDVAQEYHRAMEKLTKQHEEEKS